MLGHHGSLSNNRARLLRFVVQGRQFLGADAAHVLPTYVIHFGREKGSCSSKTNEFKCMFVLREGRMPRQSFGQRAFPRIGLGGEHHERRLGARLDVHLAEREPRLVFRGALAVRR
jgi:hypothetical protein